MKLPTTLGATIDLLYKLQQKLDAIEASKAPLKEEVDALEKHLMNNFDRAQLSGARGKLAQASVKPSTVADVKDWDALYKYISRTKSWDMLQKRISVTACRERWNDKKAVPGVEPKEITKLSLTKLA